MYWCSPQEGSTFLSHDSSTLRRTAMKHGKVVICLAISVALFCCASTGGRTSTTPPTLLQLSAINEGQFTSLYGLYRIPITVHEDWILRTSYTPQRFIDFLDKTYEDDSIWLFLAEPYVFRLKDERKMVSLDSGQDFFMRKMPCNHVEQLYVHWHAETGLKITPDIKSVGLLLNQPYVRPEGSTWVEDSEKLVTVDGKTGLMGDFVFHDSDGDHIMSIVFIDDGNGVIYIISMIATKACSAYGKEFKRLLNSWNFLPPELWTHHRARRKQ